MDYSLLRTLHPTFLRESVTAAILSGVSGINSIMKLIGLPDDADAKKDVQALLHSPEFLREVYKARERVDEAIIKWFRQRGFQYAERMDTLTRSDDPRVAFQATKDLLDRIGTAPQQKVAVSGMDQYKSLLKELSEDEPTRPEGTD